jgi:hypothetical protein
VEVVVPPTGGPYRLGGRIAEPGGRETAEQFTEGVVSGAYEIDFELTTDEPGDLTFEARLLEGEAELARGRAVVHVVPPGGPEIVFDSRGWLHVNGLVVLPIGVVARAEGKLSEFARMGFGLVWDGGPAAPEDSVLASAEGLVIVACRKPPEAGFARLKDAPAVGAWIVERGDEGGYRDLLGNDAYRPVLSEADDAAAAGDAVLLRLEAGDTTKALAQLASFLEKDGWRRPVWARFAGLADAPEPQVSALAFACLLNGARGVVFDPGTLSVDDCATRLRPALERLRTVAFALTAAPAEKPLECAEPRLLTYCAEPKFDLWVVATNPTPEGFTAEFRGAPAPARATDLLTGEVVEGAQGAFTFAFAAHQSRLIRVDAIETPAGAGGGRG